MQAGVREILRWCLGNSHPEFWIFSSVFWNFTSKFWVISIHILGNFCAQFPNTHAHPQTHMGTDGHEGGGGGGDVAGRRVQKNRKTGRVEIPADGC
jgi:hypothetical protein